MRSCHGFVKNNYPIDKREKNGYNQATGKLNPFMEVIFMKKIIALLLSVLMLLSAVCVFAAAEDEEPAAEPAATYTIVYVVNGATIKTVQVAEGEKPEAPEEPQPYTDADGKIWEFHGWISSVESDPEKRYYPGTMPPATCDVTYTAEFYITYEPSQKPTVTLFAFLQGIFQNLTKIFAAATDTVKTWTSHIGIASDFVKELFTNVID